MTILSLVMLVSIFMMFLVSFKILEEIKSSIFGILPKVFVTNNYKEAMLEGDWHIYFKNSLIIPLVSGSYGVFLCKQFYENFPKSLDEAAKIDGANRWKIFF